mgnify:CR=1 FL=1
MGSPGIRPGKPTSDYLDKILNYIVFIGAVALTVVAVIPIAFSGIFSVGRISFSGTSLIIIVKGLGLHPKLGSRLDI